MAGAASVLVCGLCGKKPRLVYNVKGRRLCKKCHDKTAPYQVVSDSKAIGFFHNFVHATRVSKRCKRKCHVLVVRESQSFQAQSLAL